MREVDIQAEIMLEATRLGHRLERNNVGVARHLNDDDSIRYVRYGVGGKGAGDLVGWTRRRIYTAMPLGCTVEGLYFVDVPIYTAVECKKLKGKKLEDQKKRIAGLLAHGCIAGFCFSVEDYRKLVGATS